MSVGGGVGGAFVVGRAGSGIGGGDGEAVLVGVVAVDVVQMPVVERILDAIPKASSLDDLRPLLQPREGDDAWR